MVGLIFNLQDDEFLLLSSCMKYFVLTLILNLLNRDSKTSSQSSKNDLSGMLPCALVIAALVLQREHLIFFPNLFPEQISFLHMVTLSAHTQWKPSPLFFQILLFPPTFLPPVYSSNTPLVLTPV